jgi:hypothetical protein
MPSESRRRFNMTSRPDFFCEDFQEFGAVIVDMAHEAESLALATPGDGCFLVYRQRLFAVARELSAIGGGLRTMVAIEQRSTKENDGDGK